jgi:hypothetical protein
MRATKTARHPEVGAGRARRRRTPAHPDLAKSRPRAHASSRQTALSVEMDDYDGLLRRDPVAARRLRARMRRRTRGAALRYGGEVLLEAQGRVECRFPSELTAALAAAHARAALEGERGVAARIVVHAPGDGPGVVRVAARDLARPGDVLVLGDVGRRLSAFPEVDTRPLGRFLLAGVPSPVLVTLLEWREEDAGEVAAWSAPWMARLARRGALTPQARGAQK